MQLIKYIDNFLDGLVSYYIYGIVFFHVAYVLLFIGLFQFNREFLSILDISIQTFICIFLIIKFFFTSNYFFIFDFISYCNDVIDDKKKL